MRRAHESDAHHGNYYITVLYGYLETLQRHILGGGGHVGSVRDIINGGTQCTRR